MFAANEKLSELYNEFCARITSLRRSRVTQQADVERQSMLSQATGGVDTTGGKGTKSSKPNEKSRYATGAVRKEKNGNRPADNDFSERYRLPSRQPPPKNTNTRNNASSIWFPFQTYNPNITDQNLESQHHMSLRNDREREDQYNRTEINDPRLSAHFRTNDQSFSHIPYQKDSSHFPPRCKRQLRCKWQPVPRFARQFRQWKPQFHATIS